MKKIMAVFVFLIMIQNIYATHFSDNLLEMREAFVKRFMRGDLYTPSRGYCYKMTFSYTPSREDIENYVQKIITRNYTDYLEDGRFNNEKFYRKESFKAYQYFKNEGDKRIVGCSVFGVFGIFIILRWLI